MHNHTYLIQARERSDTDTNSSQISSLRNLIPLIILLRVKFR